MRSLHTDGHPLDGSIESPQQAGVRTVPRAHCPACGAADDYTPTVQLRGSFSWLVFFAGGIFAVLFRNAGRPKKVRCNQCEALFDVRTPLSKASRVIFWLLICPVIIGLIILIAALLHTIISG